MRMKHRRWPVALAVLVIAVVAALVLYGRAQADLARQSAQSVKDAVLRSAVQCYAVEGAYPGSVDYLETHYGLMIDHKTYIVSYEAFSSNLLPQVEVLVRGDEGVSG